MAFRASKRHFLACGLCRKPALLVGAMAMAPPSCPAPAPRSKTLPGPPERCPASRAHARGDHRPRPGTRAGASRQPCGWTPRWPTPSPSCWTFPVRRRRRWPTSAPLLKTAGINLDPQLAAMDARLATLKSLGLDPARVQFTAHFGPQHGILHRLCLRAVGRADKEGPVQVAGGGPL